mgnify:CR=1 FL=1
MPEDLLAHTASETASDAWCDVIEEGLLIGRPMTDALIRKAARAASEETSPISDVRASAPYRWKMVAVLTIRALTDARKMALRRR